MKQKRILTSILAMLFIAVAVFTAGCNKADDSSSTAIKVKEISVTIVYKDKTEKTIDIETKAEFLGDALFEKGITKEDEYKSGFYTYIDGVRADYNEDKAWWCVTKGGEMTTKGMNELTLEDGDNFEITHTPS
jgi:hypothetical protein